MQVGVWQIVIILVVLFLLFGPGRIEKLGPSIGKAIRGFKKGISNQDDNKDDDSNKKSDA